MVKFSKLIWWAESHLEPNFKKICKTDFELFLISYFLSFREICHTDFCFTLCDSEIRANFLIPETLRWGHASRF